MPARQIRQPGVRDDGHAALEYSGDAAGPGEDRRIGRVSSSRIASNW